MKLTDKTKVSVVTAACLIALTIVFKNVLNIPADILNRDIIVYITIYIGFIIVLNAQEEAPREEGTPRKAYDSPWFWSALIVGITLAIIGWYAFGPA
jgi:hypothetical protein